MSTLQDETPPLDVDASEHADEEDEEEVEVYFAASPAAPASDGGTLLPNAPRRCVSREMLEQMPALAVSARYHEVSVRAPFGCFHLMQLIEKSIQVGALFSPRLFVPKEIWQQDRVKLAGVPLKVDVFHQLKQGLEKSSVRAVALIEALQKVG
jgi:hypothetical protein